MRLEDLIANRDNLVGRELKTYSPVGGYRNTEFTVIAIDERGMTIRPRSSGKDRLSRAAEIRMMAENWDDFKAGRITRSELANGKFGIRNTSYLATVFSHLDDLAK